MGTEPSPTGFDDVWNRIDPLPGWLTRAQARVLHDLAGTLERGAVALEIGSHHGRSAIALAAGLPEGARLVAIDPFLSDWRYGAVGTEAAFRENLDRAGLTDRVEVRVDTSRHVRDSWRTPIDLVYVDGKHDVLSLRDDLGWAALVRPGGWVLVHDAFSSLGVTTGLLSTLPLSRTLRYVGRTGSLARLQVGPPSVRDRLRPLRELPWWLRNLVVKVLLRLRLRAVAGLLGHGGAADPY